jgi:hypothetical protein
MTNPRDRWRHQTSAAPHVPAHDPITPGLPLQESMQHGSFGAAVTRIPNTREPPVHPEAEMRADF